MAVLKKGWQCLIVLMERYPWTIAIFGFVSGILSFLLVERKQDEFAQIIAVLMLASWLWLALENLLKRSISRWFGIDLPPPLVSFATQLVHQESLFFVIPFFFITTAWNSGQMVFTSILIAAAFISIIDPIYYRWLAPRRWLYFIFHGITLFAVLLTTLPLLFYIPTPKSYLWALGIAVLLSLPHIARAMPYQWWRRIITTLALMVVVSALGLFVRPWVPPASLWLTEVAITDHIDDENRSPANQLKIVTAEQLYKGLYAYTAIHAPRGLNERIYHQWRHNGKNIDRIPLDIKGGRESGYRAWTHKLNFPEDHLGNWQIQVLTEANQLIGVLRFRVVASLPAQTIKADSKPEAAPVPDEVEADPAPEAAPVPDGVETDPVQDPAPVPDEIEADPAPEAAPVPDGELKATQHSSD